MENKNGFLNSNVVRYGVAICIVLAALLLYQVLVKIAGGPLPSYITFFPAVMIVALLAGFRAGFLATAIAALLADYWIIHPQGSFAIASFPDALSLAIFSLNGLVLSVLAERYRRTRQKAATYEAQLALQNEREKSEKLLRESEGKYRGILENIEEGYYEGDLAGNVTFVNSAMSKNLGYSKDELIGMNYRKLSDEATAKKNAELFNKLYRTGEPVKAFGIEYIRKDGITGFCELSASLIRDAEGKPIGFRTLSWDITARKQMEDALLENRKQYELAMRSAHMGAWHLDITPYKLYYDEQAFHLLGIDPANFTGTRDAFLEVVHPDDRGMIREAYSMFIEHNAMYEVEYRVVWPDRSIHHISSRGMLVRDDADRPVRINGVVWDITDRKHAEEALQNSERRYRRLFESAKDGILILDADTGKVVDVNPFLVQLLDYSYDELLGKHIWDIGLFKDIAASREAFKILQDNEYICYEDLPLETRDGQAIAVEFVSNSYRVDHTKVIQCNIRDVTKRVDATRRENLTREVLELLNRSDDSTDTVREILHLIKSKTGLEALGIRLREGDDFPYYETNGFPEEFVQAEKYLCAHDKEGKTIRDGPEDPVLEGMCGNILCGRINPELPCFTKGGSFWTNSTTELLNSAKEEDRRAWTRNRCNAMGYESLAIIALRSGDETIGLLQINDHRRNQFTPEMIAFLEGLGASIGITLSRRRAEDAQKEQLNFLQVLIDTIPIPIYYKDKNGIYLGCNRASEIYFGPRDQMIGKTVHDISPEDHIDTHYRADCELMNNPGIQMYEGIATDKTGTNHSVIFQKATYPDKNGNVAGLIGAVFDITERKVSEKALQDSEARYRAVADNAQVGIYITQDRKYRFVNHFMIHNYGYSYDELIGNDAFLLLHPEDKAIARERAVSMLKEGSPNPSEHRFINKDGRITWVAETVASINFEGKRATLGITMNINERKMMEKQLQDAREMLIQSEKLSAVGKLSAGVAHEVLNPINIISMRMQMLEMTENLSEKTREMLKVCSAQIDRVVKIVKQLSQFSRLNTQHASKEVELKGVIERILDLLSPRFRMENIKVEHHYGSGIPPVRMDESLLEQVIFNIINNAMDAVKEKREKTIRITASLENSTTGRSVRVVFADNGIGIQSQDLPKIFDPFFTTKEPGKGQALVCPSVMESCRITAAKSGLKTMKWAEPLFPSNCR